MGVAEVIPGISGGTLALILGIYERLINAISSFNLDLISLLKSKRIIEAPETKYIIVQDPITRDA